jgi:hypothetical protein
VLRLANAELRFVPARDGRGDGLSAIGLAARNCADIVAIARSRGALTSAGTIVIGGVRIDLCAS